jgi:DNA-binding NarL/FixJ family response regulator
LLVPINEECRYVSCVDLRPESLTPREQEILELIWAGFKKGDRATAQDQCEDVEVHRSSMMKKMRVHNTAELLNRY